MGEKQKGKEEVREEGQENGMTYFLYMHALQKGNCYFNKSRIPK